MANKQLILAIDVGTSSVRAAFYDHAGKMVRGSLVKNERKLTTTTDGGSEIDADKAFKQIVAVIDEALKATDLSKVEITHVATTSFWHSLVGIDAAGKATTPVLSWADNRSRDLVATLREDLDEKACHNRTGARFHSSFWPAKLLWFRKTSPDVWRNTAKWLSFSDYVGLRLSGITATSISMASGTGIFDTRKIAWDSQMQHYIKLKASQLPEISEKSFRLNSTFAKRWPALSSAKWLPVVADGAANNVGSGCTTKDTAALMIGTSGAMRVVYEGEPPANIPNGLWCYRIDRKRVVLGGALSDGGGLYDWLNAILALPKDAEAVIAKRKLGSHGLTFEPYLAGERSTGYNEFASGSISGIRTATTAVDILQAGMEAVGYRFAEIHRQLESVTKINTIVASGGALAASPVWTKMIAAILERKLTPSKEPEASLLGAVLLAKEVYNK